MKTFPPVSARANNTTPPRPVAAASRRARGLVAGAAALVVIASAPGAATAAISLANSEVSSAIEPAGAEAEATLQYTNNSTFLAVIVNANAARNDLDTTVTPSVTYNGDPLTNIYTHTDTDEGHSFIFYRANPATGTDLDLVVDFGVPLDNESAFTEGFQFAALSLDDVDLANPIALVYGPSVLSDNSHDTLSDPDLNAGDFLLWGTSAINSLNNPNYETGGTSATAADGNQMTQLFNLDEGTQGHAHYQALIASDFNLNGDVFVDAFADRDVSQDGGVVFNAIPEPASLALIGLGSLLVLGRRGRGSAA